MKPLRQPRRPASFPRTHAGVTLIELMVVVVVVALLAAIALPSYGAYIRKSRRVDAKNAVLEMASRQEKYYSIHNKYTGDASALGYSSLDVNSSGTSYYKLKVTLTDTGYEAQAIPQGSQQADTECYSYQVNEAGLQSNADSGGNRHQQNGCW